MKPATDHAPQVRTEIVDGASLNYLHYEGSGPDVVMLHATGFLPWLWHPIARELARQVVDRGLEPLTQARALFAELQARFPMLDYARLQRELSEGRIPGGGAWGDAGRGATG